MRGGIPPALRTIDLCLYTLNIKTDTQCYMVCMLAHVSYIVANMACVTRDLDRVLSNALQWLDIPEVILEPEQRTVIITFAYQLGLGSHHATRCFCLF